MKGMEKVFSLEDRKDYVNWLKSQVGAQEKVQTKTSKESLIKHYNLFRLEQDMLGSQREILAMTVNKK